MFLVKIWGPLDEEILVDMHVQRPEPKEDQPYLKTWMNERIKWGRPFLLVTGVITAISIITMVVKHL
jgi:hypothetical protein